MYGKTFQKLWHGSMRGKWDLQLVFIYMFSCCDRDGIFDAVPDVIASDTGLEMSVVLKAITVLESPDPMSRTPDNEGRRILRLDPHRTWGWRIPNHEKYRREGSEEHRKEQNAERQRKFKEKQRSNAVVTPGNAAPVSVYVSDSAPESSSEGGSGGTMPTRMPEDGWTIKQVQAASDGIGLRPDAINSYFETRLRRSWKDGTGTPCAETWQALKADLSCWKPRFENMQAEQKQKGGHHGNSNAEQRRAAQRAREFPEDFSKVKVL